MDIEAIEGAIAARRGEGLQALRAKYGEAVNEAVSRARASRDHETVQAADGAEAYAYPLRGDRIAWGVNSAESGFNIWRGVRRPDGTDEREM
jgi:hypothetical protein